jgi:hypothetical protein
MRMIRLLSPSLLLALLAACSGASNKKRSMHQDQVMTGATEYYHRGYQPQPVNSPATSPTLRRSTAFGGSQPLASPSKPGRLSASTSGGMSFYAGPPVFSNPDGTTSKVVGNKLVRSDGTIGDMIGNTAYHRNGTRSRIAGDTLYNPDGTHSRRIYGAP